MRHVLVRHPLARRVVYSGRAMKRPIIDVNAAAAGAAGPATGPATTEPCAMCSAVCSHRIITALPGSARAFQVRVCAACGHGTRCEARDFGANIAIQEAVFDQVTNAPRQPLRWPAQPVLVARRARRLIRSHGRVLDIGCGPGAWLSLFQDPWQRYGVDVSRRAAEIARSYARAQVFCGPIEAYDSAPEDFDLITAFALIEHLSVPKELVHWVFDHLRPGGVAIFMTGDRESIVARELGCDWPMYEPEEHVHFFSGRSLSRLVESVGFDIVQREWRAAHYRPTVRARLESKAREITGAVTKPRYDRLYLYARRPFSAPATV